MALSPPDPAADHSSAEAIDAANLGVYDFDLTTGAAPWSDRALAIYGGFDGPPGTVQLRSRVHPLDWPKLYAARQAADRHGREAARAAGGGPIPPAPVDVLHRVTRPDGAVRWVRATGEYRFGPDGTARRSVGVLRDVTDEMAERERLAAAAERRGRALAAAGLGTFDFDPRGDAVLWDGLAKRAFGLPEDAPDARPMAAVLAAIHPEDREDAAAAIARALDPLTGGRFEASHRIVRPDGSVRRIAGRADVEFADGFGGRHAVRTVGVIEDVTGRR